MNLQRLEAEVLRDSILAASGKLNLQTRRTRHQAAHPRRNCSPPASATSGPLLDQEEREHWRRSVYIYVKRQLLMPMHGTVRRADDHGQLRRCAWRASCPRRRWC